MHEAPSSLVAALADLGFVLLDTHSSGAQLFYRQTMDAEFELTLERVGPDSWRVGLSCRGTAYLSDGTKVAWQPMSLGRLAQSEDDVAIEISTDDLTHRLPVVLEQCILPMSDGGGYWGPGESADTD